MSSLCSDYPEPILASIHHAGLLGLPFLPHSFTPTYSISPSFPASSTGFEVGTTLTPSQTASSPSISICPLPTISRPVASESDQYTVILIDPDAPSKDDQNFGPWRHWIVGGLRVVASEKEEELGRLEGTEEAITPWVGPAPGAGTGLHRYVFCLYKQNSTEKVSQEGLVKSNERVDRRNFDVETFRKKNGLDLVGVTFFYCSVP